MTPNSLLQQLATYQSEMINLCRSAGDDYNQQSHPDISPVGWHLGHCVFTESYWIHERFLEDAACEDSLHRLYNPQNTGKEVRGQELPLLDDLCSWARRKHTENRRVLETHAGHRDVMQLMDNHFLLHFLIQHYAQHLETILLAIAQMVKSNLEHYKTVTGSTVPLRRQAERLITKPLPAGEYAVGTCSERLPYDNEYPSHTVELAGCHIMQHPVSTADYLHFMEFGGYREQRFWSTAGWRWKEGNRITHPAYWHQDAGGQWSVIDHRGVIPLDPHAPVYGLSYYEAEALANRVGGRLPHEHEWEAAFNNGLLRDCGLVWEWCRNSFFPYAGFRAYPYDGYSVPYFDGEHFTLKGGSILTRPVIKRPCFRNYYQADKNFLYAGVRLAFDNIHE